MSEQNMRRAFTEGLQTRQLKDGRREISGVAMVYNSTTQPYLFMPDFSEEFAPGAFADSFAPGGRDIIADLQHDRTVLLGSMFAGSLVFDDGDDALRFTLAVAPYADYVVDLVKDGELRGVSIEFALPEIETRREGKKVVERVTKAMLRGIGIVNDPAYLDAQITSARQIVMSASPQGVFSDESRQQATRQVIDEIREEDRRRASRAMARSQALRDELIADGLLPRRS